MANSPESSPRIPGARQLPFHVPTPNLPVTVRQQGASIWAREGDATRRSALFAMHSAWPTKCLCKSMKANSSMSRSDLAQSYLQGRAGDAAKGLNA